MFLSLFNEIFFRPLFNALVVITDFLPSNDLGLAVIILTLLVRILLFPLMHRSVETQTRMKMIEPELKKILLAKIGESSLGVTNVLGSV